MNLQCGATRLHCRNAVCRVACLAWARWIGKWKHRSPTFANHVWNKGGWIQNRANTLALWCMFAQVFPLFQDNSVFSTITSVYADGFMNPAVRPTAANPTAQGVVSIVALVVNVVILATIIKRAKAQKKNPYKQEIFTDQRDFREAMERV